MFQKCRPVIKIQVDLKQRKLTITISWPSAVHTIRRWHLGL